MIINSPVMDRKALIMAIYFLGSAGSTRPLPKSEWECFHFKLINKLGLWFINLKFQRWSSLWA